MIKFNDVKIYEALQNAVGFARQWLYGASSTRRTYLGKHGKPGEIIKMMKDEDRAQLKGLTSDMAKDMRLRDYELYDEEYQADKRYSKQKMEFDKRLKNR